MTDKISTETRKGYISGDRYSLKIPLAALLRRLTQSRSYCLTNKTSKISWVNKQTGAFKFMVEISSGLSNTCSIGVLVNR